MRRLIAKLGLLTSIVLCFSAFAISSFAAQSDGNSRDMTVKGISATVGNKTISNIYSDPVNYWERVDGGYLAEVDIIYNNVGESDSVIYTAYYPDTTTGRKGNYVEYVCEYRNYSYKITKINESGDGATYIPVNGFVLSVNASEHPAFASLGDTVRLGGSSIKIPKMAVESDKGKRIVVDDMNVSRSKPMVVYYDYRYGAKTGTNIYGTEMICNYDKNSGSFAVNGFRGFLVGDASGIDIPDGGFVLSAYGSGYRQLLLGGQLFNKGDKIKLVGFTYGDLDNSAINSSYNELISLANSVKSEAKTKIDQLFDVDVTLINGYFSELDSAIENLKSIKKSIDATSNDDQLASFMMEFSQSSLEVEELCRKISVTSVESMVVSARSTWHRPCEKSYAEIEANVKMFRDIGINLVFVETFYHGCSAFKSDNQLVPYHPSLSSQYVNSKKGIVYGDYLSAFVACCVEYGIEVHAWVENFYVGIDSSAGVAAAKPEWIMYNDDGSIYQRKEGGAYIFIDPANPDVQDLLIDLYKEIFEKNPKISGLNLDYIRYPVSNRSQDTGYTVSAMKGFYELLGKEFTADQLADRTKMANKFKQLFDASYLKGGQTEANANYQLWVEYRTELITDFVGRITDEVKSDSDLLLSTAVFASLAESLDSKKADWQSWFTDGLIDIATPMAYYTTASVVCTRVQEMINFGGNNCLYYTGIASSYSGLPAWQNKEFIQASYDAGASGYVIFSSVQIVGHQDVQQVLLVGVNRKNAVLPHAKIVLILEAVFDDILDKADRIYIPAGGMSSADRNELAKIFAEIEKMPYDNLAQISDIALRISSVRKNLGNLVSGHSLHRITDELDYLVNILEARANMLGEANGDPETPDEGENNPETPDNGGENPETPEDDENISDKPENDRVQGGDDSNKSDAPVKQGFFARLWQAIANFFKRLFGIKK